jgi:hypothetical protein
MAQSMNGQAEAYRPKHSSSILTEVTPKKAV